MERTSEGTRVTFTVKKVQGAGDFCVRLGSGEGRDAGARAHLIDDSGNRYGSVSGRVGRESFSESHALRAVAEVPLYRYELVFEALDPQARTVTLVIPPNGGCYANVVIGPMSVPAAGP